MNLPSHRPLGAGPGLLVLCLTAVLVASACGDLPGDSAPDLQCDVSPVIPIFTVTGAEVPDSGELTVEGRIRALSITAGDVELSVSTDDAVVDFTVENSGIDEVDLTSGRAVVVEYRSRRGFEDVARALRISDRAGVALLVEDGNYGNAIGPADLAPLTVGQSDIGCRNRANTPGSLNNFALTIETADAVTELMPGARSSITVDGNDFAAHNLRSTARHSDVQWTDAPYTYTSFSIARLTDASLDASAISAETSVSE